MSILSFLISAPTTPNPPLWQTLLISLAPALIGAALGSFFTQLLVAKKQQERDSLAHKREMSKDLLLKSYEYLSNLTEAFDKIITSIERYDPQEDIDSAERSLNKELEEVRIGLNRSLIIENKKEELDRALNRLYMAFKFWQGARQQYLDCLNTKGYSPETKASAAKVASKKKEFETKKREFINTAKFW